MTRSIVNLFTWIPKGKLRGSDRALHVPSIVRRNRQTPYEKRERRNATLPFVRHTVQRYWTLTTPVMPG